MHHPRRDLFKFRTPVRKFAFVLGTRPEVIKLAPLVRRLRKLPWAAVTVIASGQQNELLTNALVEFGMEPDLSIRHRPVCHSPALLFSHLIPRMDKIFADLQPDAVIAQGDTTTAFAASTTAFYRKIPFIHVEAGLRTENLDAPFPEEFHRRVIAISAMLHCAPTSAAAERLLKEQVAAERILVSGNTVIDILLETAALKPMRPANFPEGRAILLTAHRRENFGTPLREAFTALRAFVDLTPDVSVYYPVHPNPNARAAASEAFHGHPRIHLVDPLDYRDIVAAIQNCWCVVTDSGGIQEEAPALGKPVLVLRAVTERPEAVASGVVEVIGTSRKRVFDALTELDQNPRKYRRMSRAVFPYGDGQASSRIIDALYALFCTRDEQHASVITELGHTA